MIIKTNLVGAYVNYSEGLGKPFDRLAVIRNVYLSERPMYTIQFENGQLKDVANDQIIIRVFPYFGCNDMPPKEK
jgi:hypothetical protein